MTTDGRRAGQDAFHRLYWRSSGQWRGAAQHVSHGPDPDQRVGVNHRRVIAYQRDLSWSLRCKAMTRSACIVLMWEHYSGAVSRGTAAGFALPYGTLRRLLLPVSFVSFPAQGSKGD